MALVPAGASLLRRTPETIYEMEIEFLVGLVLLGVLLLVLRQAQALSAMKQSIRALQARIAALEASTKPASEPAGASAAASPPTGPAPRTTVPPPLPVMPPPLLLTTPPPPPPVPPAPPRPSFDWEAFTGVKLFAWLGAFILFLGVVFFVKYSFENNLITPRMRIGIGIAMGLGLMASGWRATRRAYRIPGQSLCAAGVLVLYAAIFAAHGFYHLFSFSLAFALMSLVTVGAFLMAVMLNAQVIVILGLLGGFLTPILLERQL